VTRRRLHRLALVFVAAGLLVAKTGCAEERIRLFRSDVTLSADGSFEVDETIDYSFGSAHKHGIYRDIPVAYGRGSLPDYRISLSVLAVTDAGGDPIPYRVSREGRTRHIRIGDPDRTVTGEHVYRIRYRVRRGILWLDDHDELYWNATGTGWKVPIERAEATVTTPAGRDPGDIRALCFTGRSGSVETDCEHASDQRTTRFEATRSFGPQQGLTLVVALPKGLLDQPSALRRWLDRASDWVSWATALPLLVFFGMGLHWWRNGRDPSGPVAIPVRYEPPEEMTPAEMGVVLDERADTLDITATLLDLAVRGFLRIEETETQRFLFLSRSDYVLHRLDADDQDLKRFERLMLRALFGGATQVALSSLKNRFYTSLDGIREALYEEVSDTGRWFPARPDRVRLRYGALALGICAPLAVLAFLTSRGALLASALACGVIAWAFSRVMPRRTRKGRRARQHIQGFREFVERVEADRLERLGMRNVSQFERLLPYAFVLGVADPWADAFADLYTQPPEWFIASDSDAFVPRHMVSRIGDVLDTAGATMTSTPGSSGGSGSSGFGGGGFSGGGFGGGGGGSW
jgi:uncharacterized membrane protein YgcG